MEFQTFTEISKTCQFPKYGWIFLFYPRDLFKEQFQQHQVVRRLVWGKLSKDQIPSRIVSVVTWDESCRSQPRRLLGGRRPRTRHPCWAALTGDEGHQGRRVAPRLRTARSTAARQPASVGCERRSCTTSRQSISDMNISRRFGRQDPHPQQYSGGRR